MNIDAAFELARASWEAEIPSAPSVRAHANRRRNRRRVTFSILSAACVSIVGVVGIGLGRSLDQSGPSSVGADPLIFSVPGVDIPGSQAIGIFEFTNGCLYFAGAVAVLPADSSLNGSQLSIGGHAPVKVTVGEEVTIGGAVMRLGDTDVVAKTVSPADRTELDRCARSAEVDSWVFVT